MYSNIKNIVFDFGGVLLDIDYNKTYTALRQLLDADFDPNNLDDQMAHKWMLFETGKMNVETFIWNLQQLKTKEVPHGKDIVDAWNAMLIGWNPKKFDFLLELREKYKVFLLSNTNELHLDWVYLDLKNNHNIIDFDQRYFDKTYYSHKVGMKKPDKSIYHFVQDDANLEPENTLFIDDLLPNIDAAKSIGWQVYHHTPNNNLISVFKDQLHLI